MKLFLSIEAQNAVESGLADVLYSVTQQLKFVTDKDADLENLNNYGTEFRLIAIIPTCVDDAYWHALGWKERMNVSRKNKEADIRLRIDYNDFINRTPEQKREIFIETIIRSIRALQTKAKGDFQGEVLITDILKALKLDSSSLS